MALLISKLVKSGDPLFAEWSSAEQRKLGLENLFKKCYPSETYNGTKVQFTYCNYSPIVNLSAHRALEDVKAMKRFFSNSALSLILTQLTVRCREQIVAQWQQKHQELATVQQYAVRFGRSCTKAMAKCLSRLNMTYEMLKSAFEDNVDDRQAFYDFLRGAGITRKAWCEKIWNHFRLGGRKPA